MEKLLYEVIPPPEAWSFEKIESWSLELAKMLLENGVRAVNLPEVVNESRESERAVPFLKKMDNLAFASVLRKHIGAADIIPNKISVRQPRSEFLAWIEECKTQEIDSIVLVGKESKSISYPGLSVIEASRLVKQHTSTLNVGGITIFTRKREARRILEKMLGGVEFFVSQILFETANFKCVLLGLERRCREQGIAMPRIYLSLAPASNKDEIEFMRWLGVEFPTAIWSYFMDFRGDDITERVFEVLEFTLDEIASFLSKTNFDIGFNVEQIMYQNQEVGERLLKLVKQKVPSCL